ncbi:hypothetical protein MPLDJ20_230113 [Mesorhizobium plurifarium]|uniref:Uncharacterized protein n=1 Tax=Mesorhizobium plurifarium TaxID=69974 RepID=A0A090F471_MESPL|nr:hypothetical protein MPLDJ20_230113 [Mesorhizobium plurifarium]
MPSGRLPWSVLLFEALRLRYAKPARHIHGQCEGGVTEQVLVMAGGLPGPQSHKSALPPHPAATRPPSPRRGEEGSAGAANLLSPPGRGQPSEAEAG